MAKPKTPKEVKEKKEEAAPKEKKDEGIKHIIRIANTDLEGKKSVHYSLTGIKGIGRRMARVIAVKAGVNPYAKMGYLSGEEVERLRSVVDNIERNFPEWMLNRQNDFYTGENKHMFGTDLLLSLREDLNLMKKIRSYKGIRHETGQKVRGQRTRSTGRTGSIVGVTRKKLVPGEGEKKEGEKKEERKPREPHEKGV